MKEIQLLTRRFEREKRAREEAERILENKALELHAANQKLVALNESLEQTIIDRTLELERSEKRYRQIIETAEDFIFRTDPDGYFTYANPVAYQKLGYTSEEIIGSHYVDLVLPEFRTHFLEIYENFTFKKEMPSYQELPIIAKNGDIFWIGQNVQFVIENDTVKEITGVARDISSQKIAEDALVNTQRRLTSLITNLHSGILVEDENRKVVLANGPFCKLFNLQDSPKELEGMDSELFSIRTKDLFLKPNPFLDRIQNLLKVKEPVIGEELQMKNGKILERDYIPIMNGNKLLGHLWQFNDITEKYIADEKLKKSEEKYRGIMENMELGLMEVDNDQIIQKVYNRFCDMTGYSAEELIGKNAKKVFIDEQKKNIVDQQNSNRIKGQSGVYEMQLKKKDGSLIWVMISGAPIIDTDGEVTGSIGIHYDITDRKKLQHDLEEAKRVAEEAEQAEKQFLARMSHEIRTPLNAIIGISHLMEDTKLDVVQKDYVESLKSSSTILQKLISDILDLSKITANGLEPNLRLFDLVGAVKSLEKTFSLRLLETPVEISAVIDPDISTMMIGDDLLLNQILLNLIGNAVKFTKEGSINISVKIKKKLGNVRFIEFKVADSGIGISKDRLGSIFENFKQANNEIRFQFGGTGLGLPIAKKLVEIQDGQISVESTPGEGTTFIFCIPYEDSGKFITSLEEENANIDTLELSVSKILIAEDNFMNRKYISALFDKWDLNFEFAVNGRLAVEAAAKQKFDMILMDVSMPEMDGYDATIQIRNTSNPNQNTPIIALTASALISKKTKAFEVGMTDYLAKPFKPIQLKKVIHKYSSNNDTESNDETDESPDGFQFDEALDTNKLKYLYNDDLDYAAEMFDIFLSYTLIEFKELTVLLAADQINEFQKLVHKLKPNFTFVGLTDLEKKMEILEKSAVETADRENLKNQLMVIEQDVVKFKPLIEEQLDKMKILI